jgi:hypothetical protein
MITVMVYMMTGGARLPLKTVVMICGLLVAAVPVSAVLLLSLNFVLRLNSCIDYLLSQVTYGQRSPKISRGSVGFLPGIFSPNRDDF